jgi:hypothetical protein
LSCRDVGDGADGYALMVNIARRGAAGDGRGESGDELGML